MGTHSRGPSFVESAGGGVVPVAEQLGRNGARDVPFLFKILTAERGLSIQTHPSRELAEQGFDREDSLGIALDAPHRTYRDRNHKPELLCAVEDFWGLRGFRPLPELATEMERFAEWVRHPSLSPLRVALERFVAAPGTSTWRDAFAELLQIAESGETGPLDDALQTYCADADFDSATGQPLRDSRYWWCRELSRQFPKDAGSVAPLYLNLVHLRPGEAVFLEAGVLHAYLYGAGVELMASSDNVLRAGCTSKHVDRPELLRTLQFTFEAAAVVQPEAVPCGPGELLRFRTPAEEFELVRCSVTTGTDRGGQNTRLELTKDRGAAIVLTLGGAVAVNGDIGADSSDSGPTVELSPTESALVDYETDRISVEMSPGATVYVAGEPGAIACHGRGR
jgi:mannose-6-phosphate isomerase